MKVIQVTYETIYQPDNLVLGDTKNLLCDDALEAIKRLESRMLMDSFEDEGVEYKAEKFNLLSLGTVAGDVDAP